MESSENGTLLSRCDSRSFLGCAFLSPRETWVGAIAYTFSCSHEGCGRSKKEGLIDHGVFFLPFFFIAVTWEELLTLSAATCWNH